MKKYQITLEEQSSLSSRFRLSDHQLHQSDVTLTVYKCFDVPPRFFRAWTRIRFNIAFEEKENQKFSILTVRLNVPSLINSSLLLGGSLRFRAIADNLIDVTENFYVRGLSISGDCFKFGLKVIYFLFFYLFSFYIYPPDSQESDGGAIHRVGNYPDLLPEMPRYCCPLVI